QHGASIASRSRLALEAHPTPQHLFTRSRRPHAPLGGRAQSPGGQPTPETPGCTCDACPTYGHPSRGTGNPTTQVSTIRGQPQSWWLGMLGLLRPRSVSVYKYSVVGCVATEWFLPGFPVVLQSSKGRRRPVLGQRSRSARSSARR